MSDKPTALEYRKVALDAALRYEARTTATPYEVLSTADIFESYLLAGAQK